MTVCTHILFLYLGAWTDAPDTGGVTSAWEDPGWFPLQGGPTAGKDAEKEERGGYMCLSAAGCGNGGNGDGGGGGVCPPLPEYCRPVYFLLADTGAMSRCGGTAGGAVVNDMVEAGHT